MICNLRFLALFVVWLSLSPSHLRAQQLLFSFTTPEPILSSPALDPNRVSYLASYDRKVYALSPEGNKIWNVELPPPIYIYFATYTAVYGTPVIGSDGTLYVPSENGILLALDPSNGSVKWEYATTTPEGLYSSPALAADGSIYFGSYDKRLYAINPTGTRKWFSLFDSTIFASPAVGINGTVYCGCDDGKLYALNPSNGNKLWTCTTGTNAIVASPAINTQGTIYIGVGSFKNPSFYSISNNGDTNWIFKTGAAIQSSAAIDTSGTVYFGCDDGMLYALNADGTKKWSFNAGVPIASSPALADDGTLYFGADNGKMYALDLNGNLLWSYQTADRVFASPVIGFDGTVYFASADGTFYALRGRRPPMVSDWPMFRHDASRTARATGPVANHPPTLVTVTDQTVAVGASLMITNLASDPDPGQKIRFALAVGAPAGATINTSTGVFSWTPTSTNISATNLIGVVAIDDGSPALSDVVWYRVNVVSTLPPSVTVSVDQGVVTLSWDAVPEKTYRVQFKDDLARPDWSDLPGDVIASSTTASKTDVPGVAQRFYRVVLLQ